MPQSIKLTTDQMRLMSLFQNVTGATARDCVEDEKQDRIIFVVNSGKMGLAIGKGGSHIKTLQNIVKRNVELVEYSDDPAVFLKNMLSSEGKVSSKRFVTFICLLFMLIGYTANLFWDFTIEENLFQSLQWIVMAGLGFTAAENFSHNGAGKEVEAEEEESPSHTTVTHEYDYSDDDI